MNVKINDRISEVLTVKESATLLGMTAGGVRGAILRGKLRAHKDDGGKLVVRSHNLAAFHLYGDGRVFPEEEMRLSNRVMLHEYLEVMGRG